MLFFLKMLHENLLITYVYKRNNLTIPRNGGVAGDILPSNTVFCFPYPDSEIENGHRKQH